MATMEELQERVKEQQQIILELEEVKKKKEQEDKEKQKADEEKIVFPFKKNTRMLINIVSRVLERDLDCVLDDNLVSQKMVLILSYIVI